MKKLLKNVLSLALVLALVLSLGVTAFADGTDAKDEEEDEVEIIDIAFNLCMGEPCAVRMRELGYDDIRLNGISYKADAKDGVIAIHLGDLAAAKLLTEKKDEAEKAGIDFDKIYIRNGKVCVDGDAALSATVNSFMTANKLYVSIGDIFELSNGSELKLKVRVVNFYYPEQCKGPETVKVITGEQAEKWMDVEYDKIDTPEVTTVYIDYGGDQEYDGEYIAEDTVQFKENKGKRSIMGLLCLAKDKNDKNDYYIKKYAANDKTGTTWAEMPDLTKGSLWDYVLGDDTGIFKYDMRFAFGVSTGDDDDDAISYEKAIISTDKENVYREFTFTDKTPTLTDLLNANEKGKDELAKLGYTAEVDENGSLVFTPVETTIINQNSSTDYEIIFRNTITVNPAQATPTTLAMTAPAAPVAVDAAPVENDAETEEPAAESAEEPAEEVTEEEPAEEVKDEEVAEEPAEETEEVKEEPAEVTEDNTDAAPAEPATADTDTAETQPLTQEELDEIARKKKLAEEEAARLAAAAAAAANEVQTPTETAAAIPADGE